MTLLILLLAAVVIYATASFTADEIGYVLGLLSHHAVHLSSWVGIALNVFFGSVTILCDIIVWVLRSAGVL